MAAASGIWNQATAAVHPPLNANPMSSAPGTSGSAAGNASTISANDFLTLLVTEMKNQDPTANTDPNEYINQLVQVNSLEQLIDINQNLSTALGISANPGSIAGRVAAPPAANSSQRVHAGPVSVPQSQTNPAAADSGVSTPIPHNAPVRVTSGNLSIPATIPAAQRIGHALSGH